MSHTYICNRLHVVFSTAHRRKQITEDMQPRLWAVIASIGSRQKIPIHAVGGMEDHVHILLSLPGTIDSSTAAQVIKANSSRWMHERGILKFEWQKGFGAFSVSESNMESTKRYIARQKQHHKKMTFEEEFKALLRKYNQPFDEKYVLG